MSELIVDVTEVVEVKSHPGADRLDLCVIKGWQCVVPKGQFKAGDRVIYFPPDTVLPKKLTDEFGVTNYCQEKPEGMRIRQARLRGEPSFGLVIKCPDSSWEVGRDCVSFYGAIKFEPPVLGQQGDIAGKEHPLFPRYIDIENLQNFPNVFSEDEEVIATEKIDGTNVRISIIEGEWIAGSKKWPRKKPETEDDIKRNWYWFPYSFESVKLMLEKLSKDHKVVILYGETYGRVQKLTYGIPKQLDFLAFDLYIDGAWMNWDEFTKTCQEFGVRTVPLVYRGPFSLEAIAKASEGNTLVGGDHIKEGVVVKPIIERTHPKIGRVVLKRKSDKYLLGQRDSDTTDE